MNKTPLIIFGPDHDTNSEYAEKIAALFGKDQSSFFNCIEDVDWKNNLAIVDNVESYETIRLFLEEYYIPDHISLIFITNSNIGREDCSDFNLIQTAFY